MARMVFQKSFFITLAVAVIIIYSLTTGVFSPVNGISESRIIDGDVIVEVIHFHATQQCYSCITAGRLTEETINESFSNELKSGEITFRHVNIDLPENRDLVNKYGATGSSIMIGTYINDDFYKEENINVWYKINDEHDFKTYLNALLTKRLQGDLIQ